ncbi:FAD:protein FMN transferase [Streptococcus ratti]|uniref:FAD:protein FMN transferase n=1 Tax=Streptococcus ratti FA-1 = DSM 20564 TaxID=699248 RepID=A0ABN0GVW3_STRRT|nr:FAD:protein FMN transferase [Streptococcus ratti]EJN93926.1 putative thiamine biosynthesis lipoprotein [Streptococcus ratti FA-1 = DSM 20564]EMP69665.1 putative thiamine biosynthesis lipoprotein [Streptococcus ratti FA-1 = DSM 20564]QEY07770.1 FAD:protein FMN transferase [Streptococcus ratti]VEI60235.1 putative thiamine biosynthesis lipoprotein [Streptococcus mutans]
MQAQQTLHLMGTTIDIAVEASYAKELTESACQLLNIYEHRFSANSDDSELMAVNHQAGRRAVAVHPDLFELIQIGKEHSIANPSNLNIAIGPLVQTWRIGFEDAQLPNQAQIDDKLKLIDPHNIILNAQKQTVFLSQKGMKIDLGALAKGYIADKIIAYLKKQGATSAMINLGGNLLAFGPNPKRPGGFWNIGIQDPKRPRNQNVGIVKIYNQSVVTSGIYERHLQINGKDYHHIFDKNTGYPIETQMASLSIISNLSLDGEIWTTRLFGLPIPLAMKTINQMEHIEGIIITRDNRLAVSDGLKNTFIPLY